MAIATAAELIVVHAIDERRTSGRRKGQPHRAFCQAIDRPHRACRKAIPAKSFNKTPYSVCADRLGAICNHAQRAEIQTLKVFFCNLVDAQLKAEVGRCGKGCTEAMHRPKPTFWSDQKAQRRHHI